MCGLHVLPLASNAILNELTMMTLFTLWGVCAFLLVAMLAVAWKQSGSAPLPKFMPTLSEVVWSEVAHTRYALMHIGRTAKPHAAKILSKSVRVATLGRDFVANCIYGLISIERGITSSFFLKQMDGHKGERKEEGRGSGM